MYIISKVNDDKSLSKYERTQNFIGENNANVLQFLISPMFDNFNILECSVNMTIYNSSNEGNVYLLQPETELYSDLLVYNFEITSDFTTQDDEWTYYLTVSNSDGRIMKTGNSRFSVQVKQLSSTVVPEGQLDTIDDLVIRVTALENSGGAGSVLYTTPYPVPQTLGGITEGTEYSSEPITNVINDLLFPYLSPTISLSSNTSSGVFEYGTSISSILLTATTTKKTNPITEVSFYKNNVLINTINSPNESGGTETYTDTSINETSVYTAKVTDGTSITTSNQIAYTFVYPYFVGTTINQSPTSAEILNMSKIIKTKSNTTYSYTTDNDRFLFAYPKSYGAISRILDPNSFNITSDFIINDLTFTINSTSVEYYVYVFSNISSTTDFSITFEY